MAIIRDNVYTISIADLPVTIDFSDCGSFQITKTFLEHYGPFLVSPIPAAPVITARIEVGDPFIPFAFSEWQIRTSNKNGVIQFESHLEKGWLDASENRGELILRPSGDPENYLRVFYAWKCLETNGLLIHASGMIHRGRGYVFFGRSGSGKTTVTRLSSGDVILSDDLVIVKELEGRFRVFGVPFRGEMVEAPRTNASADLHGLYSLVKDSDHRANRLEPADAVARLSASLPFVMTEPSVIQKAVDSCAHLANNVPTFSLHFKQDPGFWEIVDGLG